MQKHEKKHRLALTLLFSLTVFIQIFLTVLLVGLTLYLLIRLGVLQGPDNSQFSPTAVILIFGAASLPVGAVMAILISQIMLRPINTIINRMNRLALGDYQARLDLGMLEQHPSFKELTVSFNRMAQELEGTEMLRSDFINNFSHEFKTPIVSIAGFAKLLRTGSLTKSQEQEYLAIIEDESLRLSQMATNVLNLTKVENQTVLTEITEFNLSEQIRACILLLCSKWEQKALEFTLDFSEFFIMGNEELLKQVWINLLDNAIKFSVPSGVIVVDLRQENESVLVSVTNRGITIPLEKQPKIFNKFYQADESHAAEGNGVGLAIVKRVVDLHGGRISVASADGATAFTVTLPRFQK